MTQTAKVLPLTDPLRRLNVNLPASRLNRLQRLARQHGASMTDLVRWALTIIESVLQEAERGNKLVVVNAKGKVEKEIIFPI